MRFFHRLGTSKSRTTHLSRRDFLKGGLGLSLLSGLNPPLSLANDTNDERRFLFVFAEGGWDQCHLFAPLWNTPKIDMEPNSSLGQVGNIQYVDSDIKPAVGEFLRAYGDQTCFVHGIGVRSVAHDTCLRLIWAGTSNDRCNDWASLIAAQSQSDFLLPHVVLSGPNYASDFSSFVSRVGSNGQLGLLLPSENFRSSSLDAYEDAWLSQLQGTSEPRSNRFQELQQRGLVAEDNLQSIQGLDATLNLLDAEEGNDLALDLQRAVALLGNNVSRCVSLKHGGFQGLGYDSHAANAVQSRNLQELFHELRMTLQQVESVYPSLHQNLTVVVLSEMGRFPKLNQRQGKTHWMHTSAILIGAGIRGDHMVGAYDEECMSSPVELSTGDVYSGGVLLKPEHLGATLLRLADANPLDHIQDVPPILGAIQ